MNSSCLLAQTRHPEGITAIAFHPAEQTLVSGWFDKILRTGGGSAMVGYGARQAR